MNKLEEGKRFVIKNSDGKITHHGVFRRKRTVQDICNKLNKGYMTGFYVEEI